MVGHTGNDVDTVHDRALDRVGRIARCLVCIIVKVLGDTGAAGSIQANGMYLTGTDGGQRMGGDG